jgi:hypothetical protein
MYPGKPRRPGTSSLAAETYGTFSYNKLIKNSHNEKNGENMYQILVCT